jgi:hypothetical protein
MTILMRSPEGAQAQVSTTEAEYLKTLGWVERSYDEYKKKPAPAPVVEKPVESDTMDEQPARRVGRPRKYE